MPKITSLINKLEKDYLQFTFCIDDYDHWSHDNQTVYYDPNQTDSDALILHELAHALLGHNTYSQDVELVAIEREAWHHAKSHLAPKYNVVINDDTIEGALDSYRDWIHTKSACPGCDQTGIQIDRSDYHCISCNSRWKVNSGISTEIRRYAHI